MSPAALRDDPGPGEALGRASRESPGPESEAFESVAGDPGRGLLILCDHASNRIPPDYDRLGLAPADLERHIAYDIGAGALSRALARRLGAPAVLSRFSRLLVDPNRGEDDPTLIMRLSDGAIIPANARLDAAGRERRFQRFYRPYHRAVGAAIGAAIAAGRPPALLAVHSFTPVWRAAGRPWHFGVLWDRDPRLAGPLIDRLRALDGFEVGDNEPYSGALKNDSLYRHGTMRGLAHALLEVRNDLIAAPEAAEAWAQRLAVLLEAILADEAKGLALHRIRHYGSTTD